MGHVLIERVIEYALSKGLTNTKEVDDDMIEHVRSTVEKERSMAKLQLRIEFPIDQDIKRSCRICHYFQYEEVGDSDFGGIYSDEMCCTKGYDMEPGTEETIANFSRDVERSCCLPDFWLVMEVDRSLSQMFDRETRCSQGMSFDQTFAHFKEKYGIE